jgi:sugar O-acyltransferase (sialic acid O-acetyltransferase NeuD family)
MKKQLAIYGAGGLGREVLSLVRALDNWEVLGFIDDALPVNAKIDGSHVLGGFDILHTLNSDTSIVLAFGDPKVKRDILKRIGTMSLQFATIIHPSATIQDRDSIAIGEGSVIAAGVILTTGIQIGKHVLLNLNATVGHDTTIGNFSSVMPGVNIAGGVTLLDGALIGSGANIINGKTVGSYSVVGMGSVVLHDVASGSTVVGVPAKELLK